MATLTAKAAGGKWGVAGTWEPEQVPTAADDVILASTSGNVEVTETAKARSIKAPAYKKTWTITNQKVEIGTSTSNGGVALELGAGMTFTIGGGTLKYVSTSSEEQKITTAGKTVPKQVFEGVGGKWKLEDKLTSTSNIEVISGELNTNGQEVSATALVSSGAVKRALTLGASVVKVTSIGAVWNLSGTELTFSAGTSTIEVTDTSVTAKKIEGARTYNIFTISGNNVEILESNTFAVLNINTSRKSVAIKVTLVEKSKTMTVTEGALPEPKEELKGTSIPVGTTCVKVISAELKTIEMSNEATATVGSAEAVEVFKVGLLLKKSTTQTITGTFTTNGKEGELARIATNESGKAATLSKAAGGIVSIDYTILKDSTAAGGAEWYAGSHSTNVSGNTVWKFEATAAKGSFLGSFGVVSSVQGQKIINAALSQTVIAGFSNSTTGRKTILGILTGKAAAVTIFVGEKISEVFEGLLFNSVGFRQTISGLKVSSRSLNQKLAFNQACVGSKSVSSTLSQKAAYVGVVKGSKAAVSVLSQITVATNNIVGLKKLSGALAQKASIITIFVAGKVVHGTVTQTTALVGSNAGRKIGLGAFVQTIGVRQSTSGRKVVLKALLQTIGLLNVTVGSKRTSGTLKQGVGLTTIFAAYVVVHVKLPARTIFITSHNITSTIRSHGINVLIKPQTSNNILKTHNTIVDIEIMS